jgi:hypothetical protein
MPKLYDVDFYAWTQTTAELIRAGPAFVEGENGCLSHSRWSWSCSEWYF